MLDFLINLGILALSLACMFFYIFVVVMGVLTFITDCLFPQQDVGILLGFVWLVFSLTAPVAGIITLAGRSLL